MEKRTFCTLQGDIAYWVSRKGSPDKPWLVFLPGLTADHRLFTPQIAAFEDKANLLVWDAPSHGESRPFELAWTLDDLARWLHGILEREGIARPILVGQSLGGYIAQAYLDLFPGQAAGFISIDSAPLKRRYFHGWEIWALRHTHLMYLSIPWKTLVRLGSTGAPLHHRLPEPTHLRGKGRRRFGARLQQTLGRCREPRPALDCRCRSQLQYRQTRRGEHADRGVLGSDALNRGQAQRLA